MERFSFPHPHPHEKTLPHPDIRIVANTFMTCSIFFRITDNGCRIRIRTKGMPPLNSLSMGYVNSLQTMRLDAFISDTYLTYISFNKCRKQHLKGSRGLTSKVSVRHILDRMLQGFIAIPRIVIIDHNQVITHQYSSV